jgi:transposase
MVDHIVDETRPRGRIEIRTGIGRRRKWSNQEKGRIVSESFAAGAIASEVARKYQIAPQHLFAWRKAAREGHLTLPDDEGLQFVPVVASLPADHSTAVRTNAVGSITIEIAGAVVRAEPSVNLSWLADVLRAVRAAS